MLKIKQMDEILGESYNEQVRLKYIAPAYAQGGMMTKDLAMQNEVQLLQTEGGLFTDCCLDRAVVNAVMMPRNTLANFIPFRQNNNEIMRFSYLTDLTGPTGALPETPCESGPVVGDLAACYAEFRKGRITYSSKTLELDAIIRKLCDGVPDNIFLLGDVRGVPLSLSTGEMRAVSQDRDILRAGVLRREFHKIGTQMQIEIAKQLWTGDSSVATAGGGWAEFDGLYSLIADDYGTAAKPNVTGTNCSVLNSDVKTFDACIGEGDANGVTIHEYLTILAETLEIRASQMGFSSVEWVIVMPSGMWAELVKVLPCQMLADGCRTPADGNPNVAVPVVSNDGGQLAMREQMKRTKTLPLNGRTYNVITDDMMPVTEADAGPPLSYESSIFFVPLSVNGMDTLYFESADYRELASELQEVTPYTLHGWTDSGIYLHVIDSKKFCFDVQTKMEVGLVFKAPHLAGRIDGVCWKRLQGIPFPKFTDNPLPVVAE